MRVVEGCSGEAHFVTFHSQAAACRYAWSLEWWALTSKSVFHSQAAAILKIGGKSGEAVTITIWRPFILKPQPAGMPGGWSGEAWLATFLLFHSQAAAWRWGWLEAAVERHACVLNESFIPKPQPFGMLEAALIKACLAVNVISHSQATARRIV